MSIIPELIIQQTLIRGIRAFREDQSLIDMLFRNVDQDTLQLIRSFVRENSIEICQNYPDQSLKVPSIVILLKNENESQAFLGDFQHTVDEDQLADIFPADELVGVQTVVGSGSSGPVAYSRPLLLQPTQAVGGTTDTITVVAGTINLIDPFEPEAWVIVMEGTSAGDQKQVLSITPGNNPGDPVSIEIDGTFTIVPDATTIFKIVGPVDSEGFTGIRSKLYTSADAIERLGSFFKASYQLDIHGPDQESTIYLYIICKAIFFVMHKFLIKQGIMSFFKMSGSDMAPAPEYFPTPVFKRSLSLEFEYAFDVFKEVAEPLAKHFRLDVSIHHPDTGDVDDIERVVSSTTFDVT